ncbi:MAG: hypothetical protein ACK5MG_04010 [Bacteroidales bacterium]
MIKKIEQYINNRFKLVQLQGVSFFSKAVARGIILLLVLLLFLLTYLLFTIGLSLWVGRLMDDNIMGFLVVAAAHLLIFLIMVLSKRTVIEKKIRSILVSESLRMLENEESKEDK